MSTGTEQDGTGSGSGTADGRPKRRGDRWVVPAVGVLIGIVYLVVFLARHDVPMAVFGLVLMVGYVTVTTLTSGRWEASALLSGDTADERRRAIDQQASALTGRVLVLVLVGGCIVSLIRGSEASTWTALCAMAGGVYIVSTIVLTRRG